MNTSFLDALEQIYLRDSVRWIEEWKALLRFASISTDPSFRREVESCAHWLRQHLSHLGFRTELLETPGAPAVWAEREGPLHRPVVLVYGHYDVQPVDPIEAWETPPFEPSLREGRLYARGAEDNKGQFFYVLKAIEALDRLSRLRIPLKILVDGEEESGSGGLLASLGLWEDQLRADVLLVTDAGTDPSGAPTLTMGLRGICGLTFRLRGASRDLHSGGHGGAAPNPAEGLARLIASLHHPDGRVAVRGFYDSVRDPTEEERCLANSPPLDEEDYRRLTGVAPVAGEPGFTIRERIGLRPALDLNGLHAGYAGPGMKTIIPACAEAKLTARLVPNQEPRALLDAIVEHLRLHTPRGLTIEILEEHVGGAALRLDPSSPRQQRAAAALRSVTGQDVVFRWEGGSIPVVGALSRVSGAEPILAGFGREEDRVHAPNESFSLEQFRRGFLYVALLLADLSQATGTGL